VIANERPELRSLDLKKLFLVALIVAPLASLCASALIVGGFALMGSMSSEEVSFTPGGMLIFILLTTIKSCPIILLVLVSLVVPITAILERTRVPVPARVALLVALGGSIGLSQGQVELVYGMTASVLWLAALHQLDHRNA
jgi:hypothetical protein